MALENVEPNSLTQRSVDGPSFSLASASPADMRLLFSKPHSATADAGLLHIDSPEGGWQRVADGSAEARLRVVDATAKAITTEGGLSEDGIASQFVVAAIQHQYNYNGGAASADSLARDVSDKLPNGMHLKIEKDADFEKRVVKYCAQNNLPIPEYIRKVELFGGDGTSLGSIGVTISDENKGAPI